MKYYTFKDRLARVIAWKLPPRLTMWAYYRVLAYATTGKYGNTVAPELTGLEAITRYADDHSL